MNINNYKHSDAFIGENEDMLAICSWCPDAQEVMRYAEQDEALKQEMAMNYLQEYIAKQITNTICDECFVREIKKIKKQQL